jgi:hypothetical protein
MCDPNIFVVGVGLVLVSSADIVNAYASSKWPTITGWIVQSEIRAVKDKRTAYCSDFSWTYRVQGITFTSSNNPFCASRAHAQAGQHGSPGLSTPSEASEAKFNR